MGFRESLALVLRVTSGIGDYGPAETGLHWAPGVGAGVTAEWRVLGNGPVYAGAGFTGFGCREAICAGRGVRFRSTGLELGLRFDAPFTGEPWLRVGAVRHRLLTVWEADGQPGQDTSTPNLGLALAAGLTLPLGPRASLTPGIRFLRYESRSRGGIVHPDPELRPGVRVIEVGIGVRTGNPAP